MINARGRFFRASLDALHMAGIHKILAPISQGTGVIFTLHRVIEQSQAIEDFHPNGILEITPDFLKIAVRSIRENNIDIVTMSEAVRRLKQGSERRFAVLTFDDGYRDNAAQALDILDEFEAPFTVFATTDFIEGRGELWWAALEDIIRRVDTFEIDIEGKHYRYSTSNAQEKLDAYMGVYWALRYVPEARQRAITKDFCERYNYDLYGLCRKLVMSPEELKDFASHPLVTIGAHTCSHKAIAKLSEEDALREMIQGADKLESLLGERPKHFAFPYGNARSAGPRDFRLAKKAGFETAVTTRKGMLFSEHKDHLHALPRVSLNGDYQKKRYVELYLSGVPFALFNKFQKLQVA
jgi:peptidoglycan/xylan/chitin deacetylase (PgdA/CDA1 family)